MKDLKNGSMLSLGIIVIFFLITSVNVWGQTFHSGGVAQCEGCHTMHNSLDGQKMYGSSSPGSVPSRAVGAANVYLLQGSDQSSTCLMCHASSSTTAGSYYVLTYPIPAAGTPPVQRAPGGDFAWLKKDYSWVPATGAATEESRGYTMGHNVYAADFNLTGDARFSTAPGGTYSAGPTFGCQSCHDPHGRYRVMDTSGTIVNGSATSKPIRSSGSYGVDPTSVYAVGVYRLLGGINYQPTSSAGPAFTQPNMFAAVPSSYNANETTYKGIRVAYGTNSSAWCANCHNAMHSTLSTVPGRFVHPTGTPMGSTIAANYNRYVKTGDLSGVASSSFTSLVPYETAGVQNSTLLTLANSSAGPGSGDAVSCFSCHRAHASGFESMTRWNHHNEFLTVGDDAGVVSYPDPTTNPAQAMGRTQVETQAAYGGRAATVWAAPYQRNLCNKCHIKD